MQLSRSLLTGVLLAGVLAGCAPQQAPAASGPPTPEVSAPADKLMDDVRILSADDMQGRLVGSEGGAKARVYLLGRLAELGVAPVLGGALEHPFQTVRDGKSLAGVNLLGLINGTGGSNRALVLMAHYDHVGVRGGQVYNGADDNASGVAALLSVAASLKRQAPLHDVILALVDGEEGGLSGSRAMVADPAFKPLLDRTVLAVNLDMVSRSDRNELYAAGSFHTPALKPHLQEVVVSAPVTLELGHDDPALGKDDWTSQSDHMAFHEIGKPWLYLGVEDHPDYHRPTDDFERIPEDFFRRSAKTVELVVRMFDGRLETLANESVGGGK